MDNNSKNISRNISGFEIYQRASDGYINATQICKVHRKLTGERKDPNEWLRNKSTKSMVEKLSLVTGIPVTDLIDIKQGGTNQGTWLHPRLAVRFSMWVNQEFSLQVEDWVQEWFNNKQNPISQPEIITPQKYEPTVAEISEVLDQLVTLGIKPELVASVKLTSIAMSIPRLAITAEQGKQLISAEMKTIETPVSPRKLGEIIAQQYSLAQNPSSQKINRALFDAGLQYKNQENQWDLTEKGTQYGQKQFETAKNNNKTLVVVRWFPRVLELIQNCFKNK